LGGVSRSPIEEGSIHRTALGLRTLQKLGFAGRKAEFAKRIEPATAWLAAARPKTTDDRAMQLVGLKWADWSADRLRPLGKELLAAQRADGGWAGNAYLPSDAYATGQVLYALREAGVVGAEDPARTRAVAYLIRTQAPDGSWHVRSRAPKFQPYFESGYPHGGDQWISAAGAAWAVMALSR